MMSAASLRALLAQSIDYAGMFPPCNLGLEPALKNQAEYIRTPDAWMLGTFVLPVAQFEGASAKLSQFNAKYPLRISALGTKMQTAADFRAVLKSTIAAVRSFFEKHGDLVSIDQLEMPLPPDTDLLLLADIRAIVGDLTLQTFWEASADAAERTIALLAEHNSERNAHLFGYKLRTGGVTADAFPTSAQIAKALVAAARHRVSIKFTAGLHHPVRQFREEVNTKMHGFINVLGAAILAAEHGWDDTQTSVMLEDENAGSFSFSDQSFAWREWKIDNQRLEARRKLVTSFGSCSFDEPREDLRALNLL
jgi:hypothetical protein